MHLMQHCPIKQGKWTNALSTKKKKENGMWVIVIIIVALGQDYVSVELGH
jgi:hypothetical protein